MKQARIVGGLVISVVFLALAFRGVRFHEVGAALRGANYLWLLPAIAAIVASIGVRALRWRLLFYPRTDLRFSSLFGALNVGYLVNDVLPLRLGEVVRAYLLSQLEDVRAARALSTVAVERVLDMVVTLAYLAAVLPFVALPEGAAAKVMVITIVAVGALAVMLVMGVMRERTHRLARVVTGRLPARHADHAHGVLDQFLHGFAVLSTPRVAAPVLALSLVVWGLAAIGIWCVLFAFHLALSPAAPIFVLALVSLAFVVPASPGYVGVFHLAVVSALRAFAVDGSVALSYAFVAHIIAFAPPMVLGAVYLWRSGLSWGRLLAVRRSPQVAPEPALAGEEAVRSR